MNYYPIILSLILLGGVAISFWGWRSMQQSRRKAQWPTIAGTIVESEPTSEQDELLPHIVFAYRVDDVDYRTVFEFPKDTNPLPEFAQAYVENYPVGKTVDVFYNPAAPKEATLEPASRGDWMILALGLMMVVGSVIAFVIS